MIPFNYLGPLFKFFGPNVYPEAFRRGLAELLSGLAPGDAILDVGAGTGVFTRLIREVRQDLRICSLDPALGMLRYAPPSAARVMGIAEHLPFGNSLFKAVLMGDTVHHVGNPTGAVLEMKRVLKEKGTIVIFDIDPGTVLGRVVTYGEKIFGEPAHFFSPERIVELLQTCGLRGQIRRYDWRYAVFAGVSDDGLSVHNQGAPRLESLQ